MSRSSSKRNQNWTGCIGPFVYQTGSIQLTPSQILRVANLDHSYSLPSAPPEKKTASFPIRFLFQSEQENQAALNNQPEDKLENLFIKKSASKRAAKRSKVVEEEEIDICGLDPPRRIPYDPSKAKDLMSECVKNVNFARMSEAPENWEEAIVQIGWTKPQKRLFRKVIQVLHDEHLARLAYSDSSTEPLLRRLSVDKRAQKFRSILTRFAWDTKLIQWLHGILVDNLSLEYLAEYLDILQTLRTKVPTLVDRMIALSTSADVVNSEAFNLLLKRPWDPFSTNIQPSKIKKPPPNINPIFIVVPSGPPGASLCPLRQKSFLSILSGIGKVVSVTVPTHTGLSVDEFAQKMFTASRWKASEIVASSADKSVYLMGWGNGAIVSAMIALEVDVAGVICLAFPMHGLAGTRSEAEDELSALRVPSLFIVGDRGTNNSVTDMEIFRKGLNCLNGLTVICNADAHLRVTNYQQRSLLVTQSHVDKCIVEEISWFLTNVPILEQELKLQAAEEEKKEPHFDGSKAIPSNSSASKRKAYYKPKDPLTSSSNCVTASKLVQPSSSSKNNKRKQVLSPLPRPSPSRTPAVLSTPKHLQKSTLPPSPLASTSVPSSPPVTFMSTMSPMLNSSLVTTQNSVALPHQQHQVPYQAKTNIVVKIRPPDVPATASKMVCSGVQNKLLSDPSKDDGMLRRLISSPSSIFSPNLISSASSPVSTLGLPRDTTTTFSPVPVRPTIKFDPANKPPEGQQRIQLITSAMSSQSPSSEYNNSAGKSAIWSLQQPNKSPQIIRITQLNVQTSAQQQQGRPLPTRCTDESLKFADPADDLAQKSQINPDLFQHLKSTLSVAKTKAVTAFVPPTVSYGPAQVMSVGSGLPPKSVALDSDMKIVNVRKKEPQDGDSKLITLSVPSAASSSRMTADAAAVQESEKELKPNFSLSTAHGRAPDSESDGLELVKEVINVKTKGEMGLKRASVPAGASGQEDESLRKQGAAKITVIDITAEEAERVREEHNLPTKVATSVVETAVVLQRIQVVKETGGGGVEESGGKAAGTIYQSKAHVDAVMNKSEKTQQTSQKTPENVPKNDVKFISKPEASAQKPQEDLRSEKKASDKTPIKRKNDESSRCKTRACSTSQQMEKGSVDVSAPKSKKTRTNSGESSGKGNSQASPEPMESDDEKKPRFTRSKSRTPVTPAARPTTPSTLPARRKKLN